MFKFKVIEVLKPNKEILDVINNYSYSVNSGKIKEFTNTNLKIVEPTIYFIKSPFTLTIFEYELNEISNKNFYIKEYNEKYNLKEIKHILKKFLK